MYQEDLVLGLHGVHQDGFLLHDRLHLAEHVPFLRLLDGERQKDDRAADRTEGLDLDRIGGGEAG